MEIKAIIVDDERDGRIVLEHQIIKHCANVKLLNVLSSADEALAFLKSNEIDLLFLDINMPLKNGFDLLNELGQYNFRVIFVTAYDKYALKAIKYAAFDYLLKPIDPDELKQTVNKFENMHFTQEKVNVMSQNHEEDSLSKIALPTKDGYSFIQVKDIIRCEGDVNYCKVHTVNKDFYMIAKTLKSMSELLPEEIFFRVHKSNIINITQVKSYVKSDGRTVILKDGSTVEVSRRNKEGFLKRMNI